MSQTIYVVESMSGGYDTSPRTTYAASIDTALTVARDYREDKTGDACRGWTVSGRRRNGRESVQFMHGGARGWVSIKERELRA